MNPKIEQTGIRLIRGKIGNEGYAPGGVKSPSPKGIWIESDIPKGMRFMTTNTNGCPEGWKKVTGVDGYHLRVTQQNGLGDEVNATANTSHTHGFNTWTEGGGDGDLQARNLNSTSPTITYPSIKYLLCEKK